MDPTIELILGLPSHIRSGALLAKDKKILEEFTNIVIAGNELAGRIFEQDMKACTVPVVVHVGAGMPAFVSKKSLVFILSYAGRNEEVVSNYRDAMRRDAKVFVITNNKKLEEMKERGVDFIFLPDDLSEESALAHMYFAMLVILQNTEKIPKKTLEIVKAIKAVQSPDLSQRAKEIAEHLSHKFPIVYLSNRLAPAGERWQHMLTKIAGTPVLTKRLSDAGQDLSLFDEPHAKYYVIFIRDDNDSPLLVRQAQELKDAIKAKNISVTEVVLRGDSTLVKLWAAIQLGDLVAYYTAEKMQ